MSKDLIKTLEEQIKYRDALIKTMHESLTETQKGFLELSEKYIALKKASGIDEY